MKFRIIFSIMLCCLWGWIVESRNVFIVAPNAFRIGVEEKIVVAVDGIIHSEILEIYVQDYPGKRQNFSNAIITLTPEKPEITTLTIKPEDVEDIAIGIVDTVSYVNLVAHGTQFHKETLIPLSIKSGYIFLQTDKLIYAPKQRVLFLIAYLNEETKPIQANIRFQIRNPKDVVVHDSHEKSRRPMAFLTPTPFIIPAHPIFGKWSATVLYGYKFRQNTSLTFEVENYVLPTFMFKLDVPEIILPNDDIIPISIHSRYSYGKPIAGVVTILLGIKNETSDVKLFGKVNSKVLTDGEYIFNVTVNDLKRHKDVGWFPYLEGFHLIVKATVTDSATGQKEVKIGKGLFTSSLVISFKRCMKDFKPGLLSIIEADLTYANGHVAAGIKTTLTGMANGNLPLKIYINESVSDKDGRVWFEIHPELNHNVIDVELNTDDPKFEGMQSVVHYTQNKFLSRGNAYIAINRRNRETIEPGSLFSQDIYVEDNGVPVTDIYFLVSARGRILNVRKMPSGQFKIPRFEFIVTYEMAPSFEIVVFCHCNGELLVDSRRVDVANICDPKASVDVDFQFYISEPDAVGKIIIHGSKGIMVSLQAVDSRLNALMDENLLTKSKVFKTFASHDLSCGPGGGLTTDMVLHDAGLVILSNFYSPQNSESSCKRIIRKKRQLASTEKSSLGIHIDSNSILEDEDEFEKNTVSRRSFQETWIFTEIYIGPEGQAEFPVSLPHSVTSWMIHAVSLSPDNGICVTDLKEVKSMKKIFLQLNLPRSIVKYQQIEIKATVFNYGSKKLVATIYMYGIKDICSTFLEGQKSERKRVFVDAHSAQSVYFPIIPLKEGTYHVKVVVLSFEGSDVVVQAVDVLPEGERIEKHLTVLLDPYNQRKRSRRIMHTESYFDSIDDTQKQQVTAINLKVPENVIPGTESCIVSVVGDQVVPIVETYFRNPEIFSLAPRGSGEDVLLSFAPAVYIIKYLKSTGKSTLENMEKGYDFIRRGYTHQLQYRKTDGSFTTWMKTPSSIWLTAFVTRVLCQASELIYVDPKVICESISWLVSKQNQDGSFEEVKPVYHVDMMGGIKGKEALTSYILLALQSCQSSCDSSTSQHMAMQYVESILNTTTEPCTIAVMAYALSLGDSDMKYIANDKLLAQGRFNADDNTLYWNGNPLVASIETTSYALLTQLQFKDIVKSNSIVNWINTKRFSPLEFKSLQDTTVALNALSDYVFRTRVPSINMALNFSLSNDRHFHKILTLHGRNAHILQEIKVNKVGGMLFIHTSGIGIGFLDVKLMFNLPTPPQKICKYSVMVNVSDAREQHNGSNLFYHPSENNFDFTPGDPKKMGHSDSMTEVRSKEKDGIENHLLNVTVCVKYLGDHDAGMSIVDIGVFAGYSPVSHSLNELVNRQNSSVDGFEVSGNGVLFYLTRVPHTESYCFSFQIKQEFIAGNIELRAIKVYDFSKPEEFCSMFYRPDKKSPLLQTMCGNGICICAEGGCPPRNPFHNKERHYLYAMACDDHDYVWKGRVINNLKVKNGFRNLEFLVQEVFKEGVESTETITGEIRTLTLSNRCKADNLVVGQEYIIMGQDGKALRKFNDEISYNYLLDSTSKIQTWRDKRLKESEFSDRQLQRNLLWLKRQLQEEECG